MTADPGWYPDPDGQPALRYWDGSVWTEHLEAATPKGSTSSGPWPAVVAVLAVSVLAVWGFVAWQAVTDDDDATTVATADADGFDETGAEGDGGALDLDEMTDGAMDNETGETGGDGSDDDGSDDGRAADDAAEEGPTERPGTLIVEVARLRALPALDAEELTSIDGQAGRPLTVVGEPVEGWYQVRIDGVTGWMFGAFVLPAADGFTVVRTVDFEPVVLLDADGDPLPTTNRSGSFALVTDTADADLWPVVLPEGGMAHVDPDVVTVLS